ncbi:hypothetical protein [Cardinium endosymbiont of Tipula unca]|uniref:hypothetical protein n=1 Tax=Cardinium endosymbiont of Tipula unca TaxID=3066216 RepID=UPI0030CD0EC8
MMKKDLSKMHFLGICCRNSDVTDLDEAVQIYDAIPGYLVDPEVSFMLFLAYRKKGKGVVKDQQ